MRRFAIIPARGGSKRIPNKNIKDFAGQPIISFSIQVALQSELFDRVIVSTDSDAIAKIALDYGAEVPFTRPDELSEDFSTTGDVMAHAAEWALNQPHRPDFICCVYATAPLLRVDDLVIGYEKIAKTNCDYVFSATEFSFPVQRGFTFSQDNKITLLNPEHALTRSQDLPKSFHDAGQFYWGKLSAFLEKKPIFSEDSNAVILPRLRTQDIDTMEDWKIAEALFQLQQEQGIGNA